MAHEQLSFTFDPESDVIIWVELGVGTDVHACCIHFSLSQLLAQNLSGSLFSASGSYYVAAAVVVLLSVNGTHCFFSTALSLAYSHHDGTDMCRGEC